MKRVLCIGLCLLLLLGAARAFAQSAPPTFGALTSYLTDKEMQKVIVCVEDKSVWALSEDGKVFYKASGAADFVAFGPTAAIRVTDLAGYNASEMYFLTRFPSRLYQVKNSAAPVEITLPESPGQDISNIAVVHGSINPTMEGYFGKRDWLAIAAFRMAFALFRDDGSFGRFTPVSTGSTPDVKLTNSGYKSLDFEYRVFAASPCYGNLATAYYNRVGNVMTEVLLPGTAQGYRETAVCTYFEAPFNQEKDGGKKGFEYWSATGGLYVKRAGECDPSAIRKILSVGAYDLEELNFFRDIFNTRLIMAAAEDGLYVGNSNPDIPTPGNVPPGSGQLDKVPGIDTRVLSIGLEMDGECDKVVWLATKKGIMRLPVNQPALSVDKYKLASYGELVSVDAGLKDDYCVSNGEKYRFKVNLPVNNTAGYSIEWFSDPENYRDRKAIPGTAGVNPIVFDSRGWYGAKITTPCGGTIEVGPFWLRDPEPVVVDFNYPPVVSMYAGCSYTFRARSGNVYQWSKDGQVINGQTSNVLVAKEPGLYQLAYQDYCTGGYTPVAPVRLEVAEFPVPVVTRSKALSICYGEQLTLSVQDPGIPGVGIRWRKNGVIISGQTSGTLEVGEPGNYQADFFGDGSDCYRPSATEVVDFKGVLTLEAPPQFRICTLTGQQLKLTAPEGFAKYFWNGVPGSSVLTVTEPGEYTLMVEDAAGCRADAVYLVVPYCPPPVPPNAFSPNGDGSNDTWTVAELGNDPMAVLRIYNRYGVLVFTGDQRKPEWDGRFRGADSPAGTYYFVVTQKISSKVVTGALTLIR